MANRVNTVGPQRDGVTGLALSVVGHEDDGDRLVEAVSQQPSGGD